MSDLKPIEPTVLDSWLLEARPPRPAPDLVASVMAAVREEARHAAPERASRVRSDVPPPLVSGGALWRPAFAMIGAFVAVVLALALWSGTPGGEHWVPVLREAVQSPVFPWLAGTLLACAAGVAIPMAWMEA